MGDAAILLPKWYVVSGQLNVAILGETAYDAALRAIQNFPDKTLGNNVFVNQHGYSSVAHTGDTMFETNKLLSELDMS